MLKWFPILVYKHKLRGMMKRIVSKELKPGLLDLTAEESIIMNDLIKYRYVDGESTMVEHPTYYIIVLNPSPITLEGWEFLTPPPDWKTIVPILISLAALLVSALDH